MSDLYLTAGLLVALSAAAIAAGIRLASRLRQRPAFAIVAAIGTFGAILVALLVVRDDLHFALIFPSTGVPVVGEAASLPFAGLLIGLITPYLHGSSRRRALFATLLGAAAVAPLIRTFAVPPPATRVTGWRNGVCLQTSDVSCSAASAATLLHAYGVEADEPEMAALCLTRADGTAMLGVYRGLRLKADPDRLRVTVMPSGTIDDLRRAARNGPVLLSVGLDRWPRRPVDPRYERDWGWLPGARHAVVLFRFLPDNRIDVGDPAVGRERWPARALDVLWHGQAIFLKRDGPAPVRS